MQDPTSEAWVVVAMVLTALAADCSPCRSPRSQQQALTTPDDGAQLRRLRIVTGLFNLLGLLVVVLMIVRPGSSYV